MRNIRRRNSGNVRAAMFPTLSGVVQTRKVGHASTARELNTDTRWFNYGNPRVLHDMSFSLRNAMQRRLKVSDRDMIRAA